MKRTNLIFLFSILLAFVAQLQPVSAAKKSVEGVFYYKIGYYDQAQDMLLKDLNAGNGEQTEIYYYLGNIEFKFGNMEKAAEYYAKGIALDPKDPFNQIGLLRLKIQKEPEVAAEGFKQIQKKNKKKPEVAIEIGRAYLDNKQSEAASDYQALAYERDNQYAPAHILWADICNFLGDGGVAATYYEQAIMADPDSYEAYVKYSRVISYVNFDAAVERLNELKAKDPSLSLADKELSEIYYKRNKFTEAAQAYSDYIKAGNYMQSDLKQYAVTLLFAGRHQESLDIANKGLSQDPTDPAFCRMAMYNLIDLKRYDEAKVAADNFFKKSKNPEFTYYDYVYEARLFEAEEDFLSAAASYLKAIECDSTQKNLYQMASQAYESAGDKVKAVEAYELFINEAKDAKNADNLMELGKRYYGVGSDKDTLIAADVKTSMLEKASITFGEVSKLEPDNYRSYYWKGHAESSLDPEAERTVALDNYKKAYEIAKSKEDERYNPVMITCLNYLAVYYYKQYEAKKDEADKAKCLEYAEEVLILDPMNSLATQLLTVYGGAAE